MQRFLNLCALVLLALTLSSSQGWSTDIDMAIRIDNPTHANLAVIAEPQGDTFLVARNATLISDFTLAAGPTGATATTKPTSALQDFTFVMKANSITNKLFLACVTSGVYGKVIVYFRKVQNNTSVVFYQMELKEVRVKAVEMNHDDEAIKVKVTLSPTTVALTAFTAQANGQMVAGETVNVVAP